MSEYDERKKSKGGKPGVQKGALHPRNRHQGRYDFASLKLAYPELSSYVAFNEYGDESIDFANPTAVKSLNRALLKKFYGVSYWDIPEGNLCPPIPGRADYLHYLADLLGEGAAPPHGPAVRILDIGVGANCIYPLIGQHEYGWSFVGADVNPKSIENANELVKANGLSSTVELRLQTNEKHFFQGIIKPGEFFSASLCNPPFHASLAEAQAGSARKWKGLGKRHEKQKVNFGGQGAELWCEGGELAFLQNMIEESAQFSNQVGWFSSLVSKAESLPNLNASLRKVRASHIKVLEMAQGQKKSRVLAWSFRG